MYSDYIITIDENGEPYIAHAFGIGSWIKRVVKYDKKEPDGKGGWRYYYNTVKRKAGTAAKKAWGSKAGRWIDSHDAGITERIMANRLSRKAKRASRKGYNDDATAYSKRSAELRRESKSEREAAKEAIKRLLSRNGDKKVVNLGEYTVVYPNPDTVEQNPDKTEYNRPTSHQKNVTGTAKDGWNKRRETVSEAQTNKTLNDLHDLHETYEKAANEFSYYNGGTYDNRPYSSERARKTSAQEKHQKQQAMKTAEADYQKKKDEIVKTYERSLESGGYVKKTKPKERIVRKSNDSYALVDTLENDAKAAHLDDLFSALEKAGRETSDAYKAAVKKAEKRREYEQTHVSSGANMMPYDDPAYLEALRKEQDIEDILNRILYK